MVCCTVYIPLDWLVLYAARSPQRDRAIKMAVLLSQRVTAVCRSSRFMYDHVVMRLASGPLGQIPIRQYPVMVLTVPRDDVDSTP